MYKLFVRTTYKSTPKEQVTVTVLEFNDKCEADCAFDNLTTLSLKDELRKEYILEIVTKLY